MAKKQAVEALVIAAPNFQTMDIPIRGTAPLVQHRFGKKAVNMILGGHTSKESPNKKKKREVRDPEQDYKDATHLGEDGRYGIPAPAFRNALISACRVAGFQMTRAKLSVFVVGDTIDDEDGSPLVHIEGEPEMYPGPVRLASGVTSIAIRPMFKEWSATVRVRWDADQFSSTDLVNLMARAGLQVGVGEGRPDSKKSNGMGWGTFEVVTDD